MPTNSDEHDAAIAVVGDADLLAACDEGLFADDAIAPPTAGPPSADMLQEILDGGARLIVVLGDDAYIGRIASLYDRHLRGHPTPLRLCVLHPGSGSMVADVLEAPSPSPKSMRAIVAAVNSERLTRRTLSTLRVTSSARPAADLGFSFGAGLLFDLFEASKRASSAGLGSLAAEVGRLGRRALLDGDASPMKGARIAIDRRPQEDAPAYLIAGSLERSWMGLEMRDDLPVSLRTGDSPRSLIGQVTRNRAVPRLLRSGPQAASFDTIHIDWSHGYVLDGELYEPSRPYVVQIAPGPPLHFFQS